MRRAPKKSATSKARSARRGWSSNVCREAKTSCWKRVSTAGPPGSTHFSSGDAMETTATPASSSWSFARRSSSSVKSRMFLPTMIRSSADMPISRIVLRAIPRSGENSSVMAAMASLGSKVIADSDGNVRPLGFLEPSMLELRAEYLEYREGHLMDDYNPQASVWGKLTGTTPLTAQTAVVIKQTYLLFGLSVFMAIVGGYIGATSETLARFFSGWLGWIVAILLLNIVPRIAMAARHNPMLGTAALVGDGF